MSKKKSAEAVAGTDDSPTAVVSRFQKFTPTRVHRRQLVNAPYNPRVLDDAAKKRLKKSLRTHGLVETPVWNEVTGHIVGGHQRVSILDDLEGSDDYLLDVAKVHMPLAKEKALNVMLNNENVTGTFDLNALADILKELGSDFESTGFEAFELQAMYADNVLESMFERSAQPEAAEIVETIAEMQGKSLDEPEDVSQSPPQSPAPLTPDQIADLRAKRAEHREKVDEEERSDFYTIVVFPSAETREAFMTHMGCSPDEKYLNGVKLLDKLNSTLLSTNVSP